MITLGDEVKDIVSGFKGIAVVRHTYLQGCDRISVQPLIDQVGSLLDAESFDEPQLKILKVGKVKRTAHEKDPGGQQNICQNQN